MNRERFPSDGFPEINNLRWWENRIKLEFDEERKYLYVIILDRNKISLSL